MMANAQKMIEIRKKTLGALQPPQPAPLMTGPPPPPLLPQPALGPGGGTFDSPFVDKAKKIADLQVSIIHG